MSNRDGGPAFPEVDAANGGSSGGTTLRDYFAGQALAGLVQFADAPTRLKPAEMAEAAYKIADAMLVERATA